MKHRLSTTNLISINSLAIEDVNLIFDTATNFKNVINRPIKKVPSLRDITVANVFFENSTRTKISFELAQKRLSADIVNFSASSSSIEKGETLLDTMNNILAMKVDVLVIRHPFSGVPEFLSKHTNASIINAGDGNREHPTQALLDCYSIKEKFGKIKGLKITLIGDVLHSRVALSNILLMKKLGAEIKVCGPLNLMPYNIEDLGVSVELDINKAISWSDVAMFLRIQFERQEGVKYLPSTREYIQAYGFDSISRKSLSDDLLIMHPGPINKGLELTTELTNRKNSIILEQVENGVAIRMAVLYLLTENKK